MFKNSFVMSLLRIWFGECGIVRARLLTGCDVEVGVYC